MRTGRSGPTVVRWRSEMREAMVGAVLVLHVAACGAEVVQQPAAEASCGPPPCGAPCNLPTSLEAYSFADCAAELEGPSELVWLQSGSWLWSIGTDGRGEWRFWFRSTDPPAAITVDVAEGTVVVTSEPGEVGCNETIMPF